MFSDLNNFTITWKRVPGENLFNSGKNSEESFLRIYSVENSNWEIIWKQKKRVSENYLSLSEIVHKKEFNFKYKKYSRFMCLVINRLVMKNT